MCLSPVYVKSVGCHVACGKCFECKVDKSIVWAYRITQEAQLHEDNCFITLTYNDANLPGGASLCLRDLQKFIKRLRKAISPIKIRYFACGEYGSKRFRPHYHLIIFGWKPDDLFFHSFDNKKNKLFRSPILEKCWTFGFSSVGDVTFESAKYTAIYMQKPPSDGRKRPFVVMSRRPGLGADFIKDDWLLTDKMYLDGYYKKIPRYFLDLFERKGFDVSALKERRVARAIKYAKELSVNAEFESRNSKIKKVEKKFRQALDSNKML